MAFLTALVKSLAGTVCNTKALVATQINNVNQAMTIRSRHSSKSIGAYSRLKCKQIEPRCGKEAMARVICRHELQPIVKNDDCCDDKCRHALPRFDDLYYKPSDKTKRKYTRTWSECPRIFIYPREVCCYDNIKYAPLEKRKFFKPVKPICPVLEHCLLMYMCRNRMATRCAKLTWPGCKKARDPPTCALLKKPSKCRRRCPPYPSFSECKRDLPPPLPLTECKCLQIGAVCRSKLRPAA